MKKIYISVQDANNMRNHCIDEVTGTTEWDSFILNSNLRGEEVIEIGEENEEES